MRVFIWCAGTHSVEPSSSVMVSVFILVMFILNFIGVLDNEYMWKIKCSFQQEWINLVDFLPFSRRETTFVTSCVLCCIIKLTGKWSLILKERFFSSEISFFPFRVDSSEQGRQNHFWQIGLLCRCYHSHNKETFRSFHGAVIISSGLLEWADRSLYNRSTKEMRGYF